MIIITQNVFDFKMNHVKMVYVLKFNTNEDEDYHDKENG